MSQRNASTMGGKPLEAAFTTILRANSELAQRIRKLEERTSNSTAPADTRFESELDPITNSLNVYLRRVSTGDRLALGGGAVLTDVQLAQIVTAVLAQVPVAQDGVDGVDGAPGTPGPPGVVGFIDGGTP